MNAKNFVLAAVVIGVGCDGATGDPGAPGEQGQPGEQGEQGAQGEQGEPGLPGSGSVLHLLDATGADMGIVMPGYWTCECPGLVRCAHVYDENLDAALAYAFVNGQLCQPGEEMLFFQSPDCTGDAYLRSRASGLLFVGLVVTVESVHYKLSTTTGPDLIMNSRLRTGDGCVTNTDIVPERSLPVAPISPSEVYEPPFQLAAQ